MPSELGISSVWIVCLEFALLTLLGGTLLQLTRWESRLSACRQQQLQQLARHTRQLRSIRKQLGKAEREFSSMTLPLSPPWQKKWRVIRWLLWGLKIGGLKIAKPAHS